MFKRRKSAKKTLITLFSRANSPLLSLPTADYPLSEETVLALSLEFFQDPAPCEIHRAAVHKRAMMEILEACPAGETMDLLHIKPSLARYFPEDAAFVRITEVE